MAERQFYFREDFYKLDEVEKVLGYKVCKGETHYLNAHHYFMETECGCHHMYEQYLVRISGEDFILRTYAEKLITEKTKYDIEKLKCHRLQDGIELDRRTPKYVIGQPMHPVTKEVNYRQKHKNSHR